MTTSVTVVACCADTKEVHVIICDGDQILDAETSVLQNGETVNKVVFDGRVLSVTELEK